MNPDRIRRVQRLMQRFSEKSDYMQVKLEIGADLFDTPQLPQLYESALDQIAELTGVDRPVLSEV